LLCSVMVPLVLKKGQKKRKLLNYKKSQFTSMSEITTSDNIQRKTHLMTLFPPHLPLRSIKS